MEVDRVSVTVGAFVKYKNWQAATKYVDTVLGKVDTSGWSANRRSRESHLRHEYGITTDTVAAMHVWQESRCLICGNGGKLAVDHCHTTGIVRGLLCRSCNTGLGLFCDDEMFLEMAKFYVEMHGGGRFRRLWSVWREDVHAGLSGVEMVGVA